MPNWCYNYITITGPTDSIRKIYSRLKSAEDLSNGVFFETIGAPSLKSKVDWYEHNLEHYGTKWDVTIEESNYELQTLRDKSLILRFSFDTAWSPPLQWYHTLSDIYNVLVNITFSEPGSDFYGIHNYDCGEIGNCEEYSYQEGLYRHDVEAFWENLRSVMESINDDEERPTKEKILSEYPYFQDSDITEYYIIYDDICNETK
jgi:hypothetical protein